MKCKILICSFNLLYSNHITNQTKTELSTVSLSLFYTCEKTIILFANDSANCILIEFSNGEFPKFLSSLC